MRGVVYSLAGTAPGEVEAPEHEVEPVAVEGAAEPKPEVKATEAEPATPEAVATEAEAPTAEVATAPARAIATADIEAAVATCEAAAPGELAACLGAELTKRGYEVQSATEAPEAGAPVEAQAASVPAAVGAIE